MANQYVGSVQYAAVVQWAASTAYIVGDLRRQLATPTAGNERVFRCTTAGTSGGTEPTWVVTAGATTNDNTAVWTEVTGQQAYQTSGAWGAPHIRLANAFASGWSASGDTIYVANNHAYSIGAAYTITCNGTPAAPTNVVCVNVSGSVPPTATDVAATASEGTTGANNLVIGAGVVMWEGLKFTAGSGAVTSNLQFGNTGTANHYVMRNGEIALGSTNGFGPILSTGNFSSNWSQLELYNTNVRFGHANQTWSHTRGRLLWVGGSLVGTGLVSLFTQGGGGVQHLNIIEGVDLSLITSGNSLVSTVQGPGEWHFKDCKLAAGVVPLVENLSEGGQQVYISRSGTTGNYITEKYSYAGKQTTDIVVVRTGGATDGVTKVAWKIEPTANAKWAFPFRCLPISIWNAVSAATVNVTLEGLVFQAALPKNDELWFNTAYLGASGNPQGSMASGTKSNVLATGAAYAASGQAWDSLATAWAINTAYPVGTIRKLASNPGRLFRVESISGTGTSAATEPAGFASALDGTTVVDNAGANQITWRACTRFTMTVPLSSPQPGQVGTIYVYPYAGAASTTYYLDPKILLG
jgi:hypothetical protein